MDEDLFKVMVDVTHDSDAVVAAKERMSDVEHTIIAELCARDPRFTAAYDEYRKAVYAEYSKRIKKERTHIDHHVARIPTGIEPDDGVIGSGSAQDI